MDIDKGHKLVISAIVVQTLLLAGVFYHTIQDKVKPVVVHEVQTVVVTPTATVTATPSARLRSFYVAPTVAKAK